MKTIAEIELLSNFVLASGITGLLATMEEELEEEAAESVGEMEVNQFTAACAVLLAAVASANIAAVLDAMKAAFLLFLPLLFLLFIPCFFCFFFLRCCFGTIGGSLLCCRFRLRKI